jgi:mannose-6-phosphate isomerase-like protein (cupin superfamily)
LGFAGCQFLNHGLPFENNTVNELLILLKFNFLLLTQATRKPNQKNNAMERRDFMLKSGLLAAFGMTAQSTIGASHHLLPADPWKPVLLPSLPPLDPKGGMDIRVWVRSSMTNGLYSNVETAVAPKFMGPPPHYHLELDELMYVVEGTASILMGTDMVEVQAGGWHLRPRMIKHTFWNASDKPLRFLDMYFKQPFEEYLELIFHEITAEKGYPEGSEARNKEMKVLNDKFGVIFPPDAFTEREEIVKRFGLRQ